MGLVSIKKILIDALKKISEGTLDETYHPLRAAPRGELMVCAQQALEQYKASQPSVEVGRADVCAHCGQPRQVPTIVCNPYGGGHTPTP